MATATAHDQLDRARRTAMASPYQVVETANVWIVQEPSSGLWRWEEIARFRKREHLVAFLTAMLPPPADHI